MKHSIYSPIGGGTLLVAVAAANPVHADICDQFGSAVVAGKYVVQNNRWNNNVSGDQCINVIDQIGNKGPGFSITKQRVRADRRLPGAYPSIYLGCHYNNCSPSTNLPMQVKSIKKAETGINLKYVGDATFDASYDIWLERTRSKPG